MYSSEGNPELQEVLLASGRAVEVEKATATAEAKANSGSRNRRDTDCQ